MNIFHKAKVYQTKGVSCVAKESFLFVVEIAEALSRFKNRDWGITPKEDKKLNDESLEYKDRILSAYQTSKGKIWINAESEDGIDYTAIVIMFPDEY